MKRFIIFCVSFCALNAVKAQESMGIANSNYAGTNGVGLNPSSIVDSKLWLDVNIVGMGAYAYNNYIYFPQLNFWKSVKGVEPFPEARDRFVAGNVYRGDVNIDILGPAFTLSLGRHAIGFHTSVRSYTDATNVPAPLAKFIFEGLNYVPQHNTTYHGENIKATSLTWGEIGITYGTIISRKRNDLWNGGITLNYLSGINAMAIDIEEVNYNVVSDRDLFVSPITGKYGMVEPAVGAGRGWSMDLGVTYKKMLESVDSYVPHTPSADCSTKDYRYRIGASIMDLGSIRFDKNAVYQQYSNTTAFWSRYDTADINSVITTDQYLNNNLNGDASQNVRINNFVTWLPSYASVQADYNFGKNVFVNATVIQGFRIQSAFGVHRRSTIALTPRYERKRWEVALPISLHDYRKVQAGLMIRLNNLIIGSDNLIPLIARTNANAADIYFNLKIPIIKSPYCGGKKHHKKGKGKGKSGKKGHDDTCPAYE